MVADLHAPSFFRCRTCRFVHDDAIPKSKLESRPAGFIRRSSDGGEVIRGREFLRSPHLSVDVKKIYTILRHVPLRGVPNTTSQATGHGSRARGRCDPPLAIDASGKYYRQWGNARARATVPQRKPPAWWPGPKSREECYPSMRMRMDMANESSPRLFPKNKAPR